MEKSEIHKKLKVIGDAIVKGTYPLNPDNHDQVNIAIGLLDAESAEKIAESTDGLSRRITEVGNLLSQNMAMQVGRVIASNEKLSSSNEYHAKWSKHLALALIGVTLIVGLLQVYAIWKTADRTANVKNNIPASQMPNK